jgi:hypothetical protein
MSGRKLKKGFEFLLNTDWLFQTPIDLEHKQYVLLSYFQKLNERFDKFEVYPSFIELSLHFANVRTMISENKMLSTEKKFEYFDDELLVSDLKYNQVPELNIDDNGQYQEILKYATPKIYDYFNIAKSIWGLVNDSISVQLRRNKNELAKKSGYFYYHNKKEKILYVWEYKLKKTKGSVDYRNVSNQIYSGPKDDLTLNDIINNFSKWNKPDANTKYPIFEVMGGDEYPLEQTLLPIFKRRILSYINQSLSIKYDRV